jgi:mannose-6-phosphate isomerase-like protein (cupin superfamily)
MSYNPNLHLKSQNNRRPRVPDLACRQRNQTNFKRTSQVSVNLDDMSKKVTTLSGWKIPYSTGEQFEVYYELLCANNSTGMLKHETKDRCIRILSGKLFINVEGEISSFFANQVCNLNKGMSYELASSGDSDVEMLVIQTFGYDKDVKHLTQASAISSIQTTVSEQAVPERQLVRPSRDRSLIAAKIKQEEQLKRMDPDSIDSSVPGMPRRKVGRPQRPPLAAQQVEGVNLRPMGAAGFGDD